MTETTTQLLGVGSRIKHGAFGIGVIIRLKKAAYEVCYTEFGIKLQGKDNPQWEVIDAIAPEAEVSFTEAEKSLMKILRAWNVSNETVEFSDRWNNGMMVLKPGDTNMKSKEIPIETFFHKIVMVRDRLRVMEQRINSSKGLNDEEKVNLQQYITRIYGSLTTFNILFKYKKDHFTGERS